MRCMNVRGIGRFMEDNEAFITKLKIRMQDRRFSQYGICEVCGEINPFALKRVVLEDHHESTKASYPKHTRVLCLNCHSVITYHQNSIPPEWRTAQLTLQDRIDFISLSHAAIEMRMAEVKATLIRMKLLTTHNEHSDPSTHRENKK